MNHRPSTPAPPASLAACGAEYHVAMSGSDAAPGSTAAPFRSIQHAAQVAQPGDTITVHAGIYRERVDPPRGGRSDTERITYRAAPGEQVEIRGSEVVRGWAKVKADVWQITVPNETFGSFNPFADVIHGDWFNPLGRVHHTAAVYCDGNWLGEATSAATLGEDSAGAWWAEVSELATTITARFPGLDPNRHLTEISVRQTVFYPSMPGRNWITVRGFTLRHAATPWSPPTAEQIGLIGTHWSRGWIIEDNTITHSMCTGITLGKHGDRFDNTSASSAEGYVTTIHRAEQHPIPWTSEHIGGHIVRRNTVAFCEQAGICGSLGAIHSRISDNVIHDIHMRWRFTGAEQGAIKIHAAIDTVISGNHIYRANRGIWLDWMAQGTQVVGNILHDIVEQDLYVEVNHGPFLVANNLFLSPVSLADWSQGGAYVHNLFAGGIIQSLPQRRQVPYHAAHVTTVAGLAAVSGGDDRFFNNVFLGNGTPVQIPDSTPKHPIARLGVPGLAVYEAQTLFTGGNLYVGQAAPWVREVGPTRVADAGYQVHLDPDGAAIRIAIDGTTTATVPVTTALLGRTALSGQAYVNPDDSPLTIDCDILGRPRDSRHPSPGPVEYTGPGEVLITTSPGPQQ